MKRKFYDFTSMKIDRKMIIFLGIVSIGMLITIYLTSHYIILKSFEKLENKELDDQIQQVKQMIQEELDQLKMTNRDYAVWDDTYNYVQTKDNYYIKTNFADETFITNQWSIYMVYDKAKKIIYQKAFDLKKNKSSYVPNSLLQQLTEDNPLFGFHKGSMGNAGIMALDEGYMLITVHKILTSDLKGPSRGYVILGRYLDSDRVSKLFDRTPLVVSLEGYKEQPPDRIMETGYLSPFTQVSIWSENVNSKKVDGHMVIYDIYGKPIFSLLVERNREIYLQGRSSIIYFLGILLFTVTVFFFIILSLMKKVIFQRLQTLLCSVNHISRYQDFTTRIVVSSDDEFTVLEKKFNTMMEELEKSQRKLLHQSNHDVLTNLPNRQHFFNQVREYIEEKGNKKGSFGALFFIDFDEFKGVNDNFGHEIGDYLLQQAGMRVKEVIVREKIISRLGGDEFTIFIPDIKELKEVEEIADEVSRSFAIPFFIGNRKISITASIGISIYPFDGREPEVLVNNADIAMYRIKQKGKNGYAFYREEMRSKYTREMLMKAMDNNELQVYYQPQVNCKTGKIEGAEALLRWQHPELGMISPGEFIPLAEGNGLIIPMGEWILKTVCTQGRKWQEQGIGPVKVAVNISGIQFMEGDFVSSVKRILKETQLNPKNLELEITESIALYNDNEVTEKLHELRNMDIGIAVDDFGTGYSSLSYIEKFQMDILKIDKIFVDNIIENPNIAKMIIGMANSLGLLVIGEGVETTEQLDCLLDLGCFLIQGYYFSKPLPCHEFEALLKEEHFVKEKTLSFYDGIPRFQ